MLANQQIVRREHTAGLPLGHSLDVLLVEEVGQSEFLGLAVVADRIPPLHISLPLCLVCGRWQLRDRHGPWAVLLDDGRTLATGFLAFGKHAKISHVGFRRLQPVRTFECI